MTITATDVKLLASERFTDDADGGGFLTATVISDGVENNVFPDISDVERATGANAFRKVYAAVLTNTVEQYRSAHVILDVSPSDPGVTGLLRGSAGVSEERAGMVSTADTAASGTQDGGPGWYSTKPIRVARAPGDATVKVDGLSVPLIPVSTASAPASGSVVSATGNNTMATALIAAGAPLAPSIQPVPGTYDVQFSFPAPVFPGSVTGSYHETATPVNTNAVSDTTSSAGRQTLHSDGNYANFQNGSWAGDGVFNVGAALATVGAAVTNDSVAYTPAFPVPLPQSVAEFTWTVGMSLTQFVTLPFQSEPGSEVISFTSGGPSFAGQTRTTRNNGSPSFEPVTADLSATINRSTRQVSLFFSYAPVVGSKVQIKYARSGYAQSLGAGAVAGAFASNQLTVTPTSGFVLRAALFVTSLGATYVLREDNSIYLGPTVAGSFNPATGKIQIPVADGTTITTWRAVEVNAAIPLLSVVDAPLPPNLSPGTVVVTGTKSAGGTFTATADANGAFATVVVTGTYDKLTGKTNLVFSENVSSTSLAYSATQLSYTPVSAAVAGVNPALFPASGEVAVFHAGDLVVAHNTQTIAPQTVTNSQTVNVGRTNVSEFRVIGANGSEIFTGWAGDKATGIITFSSVTGYSQPVTITHRVENVRTLVTAAVDGTLALSSPLTHTFPADTSYLSSALLLGDMFARAHGGFQLATWNNVWADAFTGSAVLADYNEAAYPIQVSNSGSITERWVVVFTNTNTFTVSGEQIGVIASGSTASACAPLNPATGQPYFTIPALGWGTGWAVGNVYRFNTTGASSPFWVTRSVKPSSPMGLDRLTIALRGSINA